MCLSCIIYITIYILISYIIITASVDPCFLIDITDIDIGLVIFSLKWKPDCIFFTIFVGKLITKNVYRRITETDNRKYTREGESDMGYS